MACVSSFPALPSRLHAYSCNLSGLQEALHGEREVRRSAGALSPLQDDSHDPGQGGRGRHSRAEGAGPKDSKGQAVIRPILREETRFSLQWTLSIVGAIIGAFVVALLARTIARTMPELVGARRDSRGASRGVGRL